MKQLILSILTGLLIACGGGGSADYQPVSIETESTVEYWGYWPAENPRGMVIIHQGHTTFDDPYYDLTWIAEILQDEGFSVYGFEMPPQPHTGPIEKYYTPVLDLIDTLPDDVPIFMMGLSGGGWTTTVVTALEPRIVRGYSIAGDLPLDMRTSGPNDYGDWEQRNPPFDYRTMYEMAEGRLLHFYHEIDLCCFSYRGWTEEELGTPFIVDHTDNNNHRISPWNLEYIIDDIENNL